MAQGYLQVDVVSDVNSFPITNAEVQISRTDAPGEVVEQLMTNRSGQTEDVALEAPPVELSLTPQPMRPYAEYTVRITAPGYEPLVISGTEILADTTAIQNARLRPLADLPVGEAGGNGAGEGLNTGETGAGVGNRGMSGDDRNNRVERILIPDHTLYGSYPPKIAESSVKPVGESGEIVLSRVVVPQTIVVHDGAPSNASAKDYYVPYRDYIKNVASSEIYATWPQATITANVLAIMSFTLNRVYTEWYRNQGYDFTITSSTAYDHKWIPGRNIFESISVIVDDIFDNYLSRPDVRQPILTQYCDGRKVRCPGWMTLPQERI